MVKSVENKTPVPLLRHQVKQIAPEVQMHTLVIHNE